MKRTTATYRLNRSGDFTVRTTGKNHCGTTDVLAIRYRLLVTCAATALDTRGFLFDQTRIQGWFNAQRETALSCETYASFCARQLYKLIREENPGLVPTGLELALSPAPYAAEISFCWSANEDGTPGPTRVETKPIVWRAQNGHLEAWASYSTGSDRGPLVIPAEKG